MKIKACDICGKKGNKRDMKKVRLSSTQRRYYVCAKCVADAKKEESHVVSAKTKGRA